jgi:ABC-type multidrug transport system fused ATPase/permease subunit
VFLSVLLGAFCLGNAIPFVSIIATAQGCGAVVFDIIDTMPNIDAYSREGIMPEEMTGHIEFRNVSFSFPTRKSVSVR